MTGAEETSGDRTYQVLSLCDYSGNMVRPWAEAGHDCIAVDVRHDGTWTESVGYGSITYVEADVREYEPPAGDYEIAFAFPPCTDLSYSGARWFDEKGWETYAEALALAGAARDILESLDAPWMIENPASRLQNFFGNPEYRFDPFQFQGFTDRDESYTKETWLWTGGGFQMPRPDGVDRDEADDRIHTMSPSEDRNEKRSETPMGFARAVFLAHECPEEYARADSGTEQTNLNEVVA